MDKVIVMGKFGQVHLWFRQFTSIGGLTQVRDSDNKVSERCWLVLFIIGIILTCVSLQNTLTDFFNFGVNIDINMTNLLEMEFPGVTICNSNPVHCGNLALKIRECEGVSPIYFKGYLEVKLFEVIFCRIKPVGGWLHSVTFTFLDTAT